MDNKFSLDKQLCDCIEDIIKWFYSDTIELFDLVISDDSINPEYSAICAYERLKRVLLFNKLYYQDNSTETVDEFLLLGGIRKKSLIFFMRRFVVKKNFAILQNNHI